jgi:ABC-type uncharacterized transport system ATPase subunit
MKHELQNLIQGKGGDSKTKFIQQITGFLKRSKIAGGSDERKQYSKQQEETCLIGYIDENRLWYPGIISIQALIGEGAYSIF